MNKIGYMKQIFCSSVLLILCINSFSQCVYFSTDGTKINPYTDSERTLKYFFYSMCYNDTCIIKIDPIIKKNDIIEVRNVRYINDNSSLLNERKLIKENEKCILNHENGNLFLRFIPDYFYSNLYFDLHSKKNTCSIKIECYLYDFFFSIDSLKKMEGKSIKFYDNSLCIDKQLIGFPTYGTLTQLKLYRVDTLQNSEALIIDKSYFSIENCYVDLSSLNYGIYNVVFMSDFVTTHFYIEYLPALSNNKSSF
ncbi:MAG: hypothetical protein ACK5HT_08185 [Draconibacterium sp.]